MKRTQVLDFIRYAGYHNDTKTMVRLYVENRVSYESAQKAFADGKKARDNGIKCNCPECKKKGE